MSQNMTTMLRRSVAPLVVVAAAALDVESFAAFSFGGAAAVATSSLPELRD